jgi:hypothetical protein
MTVVILFRDDRIYPCYDTTTEKPVKIIKDIYERESSIGILLMLVTIAGYCRHRRPSGIVFQV